MGTFRNAIAQLRTRLAASLLPDGQLIGIDLGGGMVAYDASRISRRDADFTGRGGEPGVNALAEMFGGIRRVRARARELADNNELVDGACWTVAQTVVGPGLDDIEPDTGIPDLDEMIRPVLRRVLSRVDIERRMTLGAQQQLLVREFSVTGEVGILHTIAPEITVDGVTFPKMPAIELIEAERIAFDLSGTVPAGKPGAGNRVRQGCEYDKYNRVVAYHVLKANPSDESWIHGAFSGLPAVGFASFGSDSIVRLGVENFTLMMMPRRLGQLRGVPPLVSAMRSIRTHDGYYDANMLLAQMLASMGIIMDAPNADMLKAKGGGEYAIVDGSGNPHVKVQGLQILYKKPGSGDPKPISHNVPGPQFEQVESAMSRRSSRGGLPLRAEQYSGDYRGFTFAAGRLSLTDRQPAINTWREWVLQGHTYSLCRRAVQMGLLTGEIDPSKLQGKDLQKYTADPNVVHSFSVGLPDPPAVNPDQQAAAEEREIKTGTRSKISAISSKGVHWKKVIEDEAKYEAAELEIRAKYGLKPKPAPSAVPASDSGGQKPPPDSEPEDGQKQDQQDEEDAS